MLGAEIGQGPAARACLVPRQAVEWRRPRHNRRPDASHSAQHTTGLRAPRSLAPKPRYFALSCGSQPSARARGQQQSYDIEHRVARPGLRHRHRARCGRHAAACRSASASLPRAGPFAAAAAPRLSPTCAHACLLSPCCRHRRVRIPQPRALGPRDGAAHTLAAHAAHARQLGHPEGGAGAPQRAATVASAHNLGVEEGGPAIPSSWQQGVTSLSPSL